MRRAQTILVYGGEWLTSGPRPLFEEPRCRTFATVSTVITIAAGAASLASIGYSAAQGAPQIPGGSASQEVAEAQANALPWQRSMAAAEQEGGRAVRWGYTQTTVSAQQRQQLQQQADALNKQISSLQLLGTQNGQNPHQAWLDQLTQQRDALNKQISSVPQNGGIVYRRDADGTMVSPGEAVADFHGFGTADVEGKLAGQMADLQTNLQTKYGPAFAANALKEARQADPMGFAARDKELEMIQDQMKNPAPINPLSGALDTQVRAKLDAGSGLDPMSRDLLDQAVARASADRAGGPSSGAVATSMSTGASGAARRQAAAQQAQSWLSSGATPEDIQYRREQQNLADLSSFIGGQTPESQFRNLSGANQGAAPFYPGQSLPGQPNNASTIGPAYGVAAYQQQIRGMSGQANSWMAGLSSLLSGVGAMAKARG